MGYSRTSFSSYLNSQQNINAGKDYESLDLNSGLLVLKANAVPTVPQPVWPDGYVIFQYLTICNIERLPQNTTILPNTGWTLNHWATIHNILPKWLKFRQIWPHRRPQPSLMHYCFPNKASEHMYKLASLQRMSSIRTQQQQQQPVNR